MTPVDPVASTRSSSSSYAVQHLVATAMPAEVVLLGAEVAVRAGEDHLIIKQLGQRLDVRGKLGGL